MTTCKYEHKAHLYPAGVLSPDEKVEFEAHVRECESCRTIANEVAHIRGMAASLNTQPLAGLDERILYKIRERERSGRAETPWSFVNRWQRALMPAALAACVVLFAAVLFTPRRNVDTPQIKTSVRSTFRTEPRRPSDLFVLGHLNDSELALVNSDSGAALDSYYSNLMRSN
jgi:anti-sigma-K factor RskA